MSLLLIEEATRKAITAAIAKARRTPVPIDIVKAAGILDDMNKLDLADRKPGFERPLSSAFVDIPFGFRAAISFEEQPAGLCRHLSISSPRGLPNEAVVVAIMKEFGFNVPARGRMWIEEYEPGKRAVNIVEVVDNEGTMQ